MDKKDNKPKNALNSIRKIDRIRNYEDKMTFKDSKHYLLSLFILGVNWMVYKNVFLIVLISIALVASLVWFPHIGVILCILTPIFLGVYGKYLYYKINKESSKSGENKNIIFFMPPSLIISWILIIFLGVLLLDSLIESIVF